MPFNNVSSIVEPSRNDTVTLSTTSVLISEARLAIQPRKVILVRNISGNGNRITVNFGLQTAVANTGIILEDGESFIDASDQGYICFQGMISAIGSAAASVLTIFER